MDRKALESALVPFSEFCKKKGYPVRDTCLQEAYPGDSSSSFILEVKADWVDNMDCSSALDILIDAMWETMDENIRKNIFSISVFDSNEDLHCATANVARETAH
ncbi:MAG: hypothetical protein IT260_21220 [Saprospiraceae bacterium]|nr:hypothetical protein [Saprospiraceae bacterium]